MKLSAPETFACGTYVSDAPVPVSAPSDGGRDDDEGQDVAVRVRGAERQRCRHVLVRRDGLPERLGGSFTGSTAMEIVAVEATMPSSALKVKLSGPK